MISGGEAAVLLCGVMAAAMGLPWVVVILFGIEPRRSKEGPGGR